ncbi:MAG: MBL fold metallo-hydrolase [Thermoplasmata archaeon]
MTVLVWFAHSRKYNIFYCPFTIEFPMNIEKLKVGPLQTNCYILIEDKRCIVIDAGGDQDTIITFLEKRDIKPELILATHGHFDHILSVSAIKSKYGAQFLISKKDTEIVKGFEQFVERYVGIDPGLTPVPDDYIENDETIKLGDNSIRVVETPGHTPGSCSFIVGDNIFTGDFIFKGTIGRTDFGGSNSDMMSSIEWAKKLDSDFVLYPGHGDSTTLENEKRNNPFFRGHSPGGK